MSVDNYKVPRLVLHQSDIQEGDIITYYCNVKKGEVEAEVIGLLEPVVESVIICRRLDEEMADLVDFKKIHVYVVSSKGSNAIKANSCECGAQHTSNPRFHLKYCPLNHGLL